MIETAVALVVAHVLADFVLQPGSWALQKRQLRPLLLHGGVVLVASLATTGGLHPAVFALAAVHVAVDATKARVPSGLGSFLADQAAHLATIAAVTLVAPGLWAGGIWPALIPPAAVPLLMQAGVLLSGLVVTTRAGGFAIGMLMAGFAAAEPLTGGLPGGGRLIGILERGLIFLFLLAGQEAGIGFLIAAKSILRFDTASRDQSAAEYVIIGTLASFGWALAFGYVTLWALGLPLGETAPRP